MSKPTHSIDDDALVPMPPLPATMIVSTEQQLKAIADPLRSRILVILQHQPATAKQIATRLGAVPGTIGHHLQVLEAAGLVQVVALRLIHGIQARYFARAARLFIFEFAPEVAGGHPVEINFLNQARDELNEALATQGEGASIACGFPHVRLNQERLLLFQQRLRALIDDLIAEPLDPQGQVYGFAFALFQAPSALQARPAAEE